MADQILAIQDIKNQLARDWSSCATQIVQRGDRITTAVALLHDAVAPLGRLSDDAEVRRAAEAVVANMQRVVQLAFECVHDAGRMLTASSAYDEIEQLNVK